MLDGTCGCGCGGATTIYRGKWRRFVAGHHARGSNNGRFGKPTTDETRRKIADANILAVKEGRHPTAKGGWYHSEEAKEKMRSAHKRPGYPRPSRRGVTHTCLLCGKPYYRPKYVTKTKYCSRRCSGVVNCSGVKNPFYGKRHTEETKAKISTLSILQRASTFVLPSAPEKLIHEELRHRGVRFETEYAIAGKFCVDIYVPDLTLIIYVDGCYWHACPTHFPNAKRPRTDNARIPYLTKCGYKVILLWEHEINKNVSECVERSLNTAQTTTSF